MGLSSKSIERIDVSRSTLATEVYNRIVDALVQGSLAPGDRLIQNRLAEELGVSRTPVRDALLKLREEGAIEATGRRGYTVRQLSADDVRDIYDAREAIEGQAAALVARRGPDAIRTVRLALEEGIATPAETPAASFEANRVIHRGIVAAIGNPHLLGFFDTLWGRALAGHAYHDFYVAAPYTEFVNDHRTLVEALGNADPEHARRAAIAHIRRGRDRTLSAPDD